MSDLSKEIKQFASKDELTRLWQETKRFCLYEDFKDLYDKIVPKSQAATDYCKEMSKDNNLFREIIKRFDETLIEKA